MKRPPQTRWLEWVVVLCLAPASLAGARERGVPPSEGIVNFGKVNDRLYRGAQPDALGMSNLKKLGIKTILDLQTTNEVWAVEAAAARANGITYTNLPMKGYGRPTPAQVMQALAIIETFPAPVFVHCRHGCDRTGTIIACYRIRQEQWSGAQALQEAKHYGISMFTLGMRNYILSFGKPTARQ